MLGLRSAAAFCAFTTLLCAQGKNVLVYGNSLSLFHGGVAPVLTALAAEAGLPPPVIVERSVTGVALHYHATDPAQVAAITTSLPAGQQWDVVILQGISHETTTTLGNPAQFLADATTILGNVRAHSPAVTALVFQTYARGQGHSWYPQYFADPLTMHQQVRTTCRNTAAALCTTFGADTAKNCAIGDCAALLEFAPAYYFVDLQHPAPSVTIMTAMCEFASIYGLRAADVTPDLVTPSALGAKLLNFGYDLDDWRCFSGIADRCAERAVRRYPGSGDALLLETGAQAGSWCAAPLADVTLGTTVEIRVSSRNGVFAAAPTALVGQLFVTGQPPQPNAQWPELALDVPLLSLLTVPDLSTPLTLTVTLPFTFPGVSVLLQGVALQPSAETGNALFTTTDGHELRFF